MALTEQEAYEQALAARAASESLRAQARAAAAAHGTPTQIADGVFRALEGGPAYDVTGGAVVELTARQADDLVTERAKGSTALALENEGKALADSAARLRALRPLVDAALSARLETEAVAIDGIVTSHALLVASLGGVPPRGVSAIRSGGR